MDTAIRRLRSEAQQLARSKTPRAIRYPARFRTAAVRIARAHLHRGGALTDLADQVGVATPTLQHWLERPALDPPLPRIRARSSVDDDHRDSRGRRERPGWMHRRHRATIRPLCEAERRWCV